MKHDGSIPQPADDDLDHILTHTRDLWKELRNQQIFITGGTGFFGCWLLESFAWANDRLKLDASALVLSRNPQAFEKKAPDQMEKIPEAFSGSFDPADSMHAYHHVRRMMEFLNCFTISTE